MEARSMKTQTLVDVRFCCHSKNEIISLHTRIYTVFKQKEREVRDAAHTEISDVAQQEIPNENV